MAVGSCLSPYQRGARRARMIFDDAPTILIDMQMPSRQALEQAAEHLGADGEQALVIQISDYLFERRILGVSHSRSCNGENTTAPTDADAFAAQA